MRIDNPEILAAFIGVGASLILSGLTWLITDTRSKEKLQFLQGSLAEFKNKFEQDKSEIHRMIEKLDNLKASKEILEAFKNEVLTLRSEMDKRFDHLERIMTAHFLTK